MVTDHRLSTNRSLRSSVLNGNTLARILRTLRRPPSNRKDQLRRLTSNFLPAQIAIHRLFLLSRTSPFALCTIRTYPPIYSPPAPCRCLSLSRVSLVFLWALQISLARLENADSEFRRKSPPANRKGGPGSRRFPKTVKYHLRLILQFIFLKVTFRQPAGYEIMAGLFVPVMLQQ